MLSISMMHGQANIKFRTFGLYFLKFSENFNTILKCSFIDTLLNHNKSEENSELIIGKKYGTNSIFELSKTWY
jgi:hypothetical protein